METTKKEDYNVGQTYNSMIRASLIDLTTDVESGMQYDTAARTFVDKMLYLIDKMLIDGNCEDKLSVSVTGMTDTVSRLIAQEDGLDTIIEIFELLDYSEDIKNTNSIHVLKDSLRKFIPNTISDVIYSIHSKIHDKMSKKRAIDKANSLLKYL